VRSGRGRKKHVKYPKGGELTLHGSFGDTIPKVCGDTACADFEHNQVLSRLLLLSKPVFGGRSAEVSVRAALVIDNDGAAGSNGLVWEKKGAAFPSLMGHMKISIPFSNE